MESNRIESDIYKSYNAIVEHYLNNSITERDWLPSTFSTTSVEAIINEKKSYPSSHRNILVDSIKSQYLSCGIDTESDGKLNDQLNLLSQDNTYVVTTGHQLCLFTGPLYFVIKVLQTAKLADELRTKDSSINVVPIFWLASEDHDFPEANHVHLFGKSLMWQDEQGGGLGKYNTESLSDVLEEMMQIVGQSDNAEVLKEIFTEAYGKRLNLSQATRILVHRLFGEKGIVVLDGDDPKLKALFKDYMKDEISENRMYQQVSETNLLISPSFKIQVNPRKINLFYLDNNSRSRIDTVETGFKTIDSNKLWSKEALLNEIDSYPEKFSPNVILRPIYQEVILPNLCYIGGPGELSYWLQLKSSFESWNIGFPGLNLRNSFLWLDQNTQKKLSKLSLSTSDLFKEVSEINKRIMNYEEHADDIELEFKSVSSAFEKVSRIATDIDPSLKTYILAEQRKSEKLLELIKKRVVKAKKDKNKVALETYKKINEKLFPNGSLHERYDNFIPYFLKHGWTFFDIIYDQIDPFDDRLCVISE